MSLLRPFSALDLFRFNNINLDAWTETYSIGYYLGNMSTWPDMFEVQESADGNLMGYVMGKAEGPDQDWHGHVTAITVSPQYRRLGLAKSMMELLEKTSDQQDCWFVDLYVRVSNDLAVGMYESLGYSVFRRVLGYYGGGVRDTEEDAFDMRKPCRRDKDTQISIRGGGRHKLVSPEECFM